MTSEGSPGASILARNRIPQPAEKTIRHYSSHSTQIARAAVYLTGISITLLLTIY